MKLRILLLFLMCVLFSQARADYASTILSESGLVNYYPLQSNANDSKGSNNGTVTGSLSYAAANASLGNGATFTGAEYITISRQIQDDFTIEFWFQTTNSAPAGSYYYQGWGLVNAEVNGYTDDFGTSLINGGQVDVGTGSDYNLHSSSTTLNDGVWHHVVFVRQKATALLMLYVDGNIVDAGINTTASAKNSLTAPANIRIGGILAGGGNVKAQISQVALYNSVLSLSKVQQHYQAGGGTGPFMVPPTLPIVQNWDSCATVDPHGTAVTTVTSSTLTFSPTKTGCSLRVGNSNQDNGYDLISFKPISEFYFQISLAPISYGTSNVLPFLAFNFFGMQQLSLAMQNSTLVLVGNGTILATTTSVPTLNQWQTYTGHIKVDPTNGVLTINRNGTQILAYTGNTSMLAGVPYLTSIAVGGQGGVAWWFHSYYDDLTISNTAFSNGKRKRVRVTQ